MEIRYRPRFERQYKKLDKEILTLAEKACDEFVKNPFSPKLKTHKLNGKYQEYWSFSINFHYRIIFRFVSGKVVEFYQVGDHNIYG